MFLLSGCGGAKLPRFAGFIGGAASEQSSAPPPPPHHANLTVADLANLKNLTAAQVTDRFGKPDTTLVEFPAQIWQYRDSTCVLIVFLDDVAGEKRVTLAVTRSRINLNAAENSCAPNVQIARN